VIGDAAVHVTLSSHAAQTSAPCFIATTTCGQIFFIVSSRLDSDPVQPARLRRRKTEVMHNRRLSTNARNDVESRSQVRSASTFGRHLSSRYG
jgi:hypothetical protein